MGNAASDIVARLALNGESFARDNARLFGDMERNAKDAASRTKTAFDSSFTEIQNLAKRALTLPRTETGALNLDPGAARAAAAAAQQEAVALREIASAARSAADANKYVTAETRLYVQAAGAAANEAEQVAQRLNLEANALDRLQGELNQTSSATKRLANDQGSLDRAGRNNQLAMRNLGFQVSDVGASLASGGNLFVIFGQQIGQVGGALSDMTGKAGALGRFLTNPWVAALTTAGIVAGLFYSKMEDGNKAFEAAQLGADGLATAQGSLGQMFDLTSGKLEKQNELLVLNARLTAINLRAEAIADRAKGDAVISGTDGASLMTKGRAALGAVLPGEIGSAVGGGYFGAQERAGTAQRYFGAIRSAKTDADRQKAGERALEFSEKADFTGLSIDRKQFQEGVVALAAGRAKDAVADLVDKSLDDRTLAAGLRRTDKKKPKDNSKAVAALGEFGRDANDRIADITSRFGGDPTKIQQADKALRDLEDIIDDLSRKKPPNFEETIKSAEQAKEVVRSSLDRPFRDLVERSKERQAIDELVLRGQYAQADALQIILGLEKQMGPLKDEQKAKVLDIAKAEEARSRAIDAQRRQVGLYVAAVGDVQQSVEQLLSDGSVKRFGSNLLGSFKSLQARIVSEGIFGGLDRQIEEFISGRASVATANNFLASEAQRAGDAATNLADVLTAASGRIAAPTSAISAPPSSLGAFLDSDDFLADLAADNADLVGAIANTGTDIVVTGRDQIKAANDNSRAVVTATDAFNFIGSSLGTSLKRLGIDLPKGITDKLGSVLQGAAFGQIGSGVGSTVLGGNQSKLGGAIGGVLGKELGGKLAETGLKAISSSLGKLGGPLAGIAGGLIGSALGGLLSKTKKASSTLSIIGGEAVAGDASGNSKAYKANANALGGSVGDQLNAIAESLGGDLGGSMGVSIGQRKKKYVVDTNGNGKTKGSGVLSFDTEEEAVIAAIRNALSDGVLTGISQASQNILRSGQDLEKAITKAGLIESVPKELLRRTDPLAYAVSEVDAKFGKIVAALKEGGASADQMADAQRLYNLELADAKESAGSASQSLKDFLSSMKVGSSSPLSLRDQEREARAVLDPYLGQISRGETIDQDKYLAAAQTFLDVERQIYGSTSKYFDAFAEIQAATGTAISKIDNAAPIRTTSDPFNEVTATATQSTAAGVDNLVTLMTQQLAWWQSMAASGSLNDFIGTNRNYA